MDIVHNGFLIVILCTAAEAVAAKPNIIIMLMDDMGWDIGAFGNLNKETPFLDQMASEGTVLTDFYVANPLCSPSRAALLTGRLPIRNGFYTDNEHARNSYAPQEVVGGIQDSEVLLPEILREAGYVNKIIGKWHLGHLPEFLPTRHGFQEFYGATDCHFGPFDNVNTPNIAFYRNNETIGRYYEEFQITSSGISNLTELYVKEAIDFLEARVNDTEPFFLYWTPDSNHGPTFASSSYRYSSRGGRYGDSVREIDAGVGTILQFLKDNDLSNNTFVFFTSDNGPALLDKTEGGSNGPFLCGKQTTFEGGVRVPAIVWWPDHIPDGKVSSYVSRATDLLPTVLDIAGLDLPESVVLDGISIKDALMHGNQTETPVFHYRGNELFAVRDGLYKAHLWTFTNFIWQYDKGIDFCPGQLVDGVTTHDQMNYTAEPILFHLGQDPHERFPIRNSVVYEQKVSTIRQIVNDFLKDLVPAAPQLNWCDKAVMDWSPPGCSKLDKCLPVPQSKPYKCVWDH